MAAAAAASRAAIVSESKSCNCSKHQDPVNCSTVAVQLRYSCGTGSSQLRYSQHLASTYATEQPIEFAYRKYSLTEDIYQPVSVHQVLRALRKLLLGSTTPIDHCDKHSKIIGSSITRSSISASPEEFVSLMGTDVQMLNCQTKVFGSSHFIR